MAAASALGYQPLKSEIFLILGKLGQTCSDPAKAAEQLEEASLAAEASNHDEVVIDAAAFAALIHADRLHDTATAQRWTRHGEAILARFPGHPVLEATITDARGVTLHNMRRHDEAIREAQRSLALKEAALGPSHQQVSVSLMNLGLFLADAGRYAEAEPVTARTLELNRRLFGNDGASVAEVLLNYGEVLTALRRFPQANAALAEALDIWRRQGASDFFIGYGQLDVGKLRLAEGNLRGARAPLQEAVALLGKHDPQLTADAEFALARALWVQPGDRARSLALARKARVVVALDKSGARRLAEIDGWLAEKGGP
jgi:tetratricopeptide (TPR) repeat protein